ncbi:MAG: Fur family transcriptional regulator [Candidatus Magasanikbacteria bacterium]
MKSIITQLTQAGYKCTKPRKEVLDFLEKNHHAISAQDLHKQISKVDRASVYRTLNLLEELGIVNIENFNNEKLYCLSAEPHHHIICKKCGFSEEVPCTYEHYNFSNFSNVQHQMTLTGVCNKCNK